MWGKLKSFLKLGRMSEEEFQEEQKLILQKTPVPIFWLFGKTGSGKTSIIKYLTGADEAEIGNGFQPQTKQSRRYDFPSPEHPVVRFLDTRGLSEGVYDPTEDIEEFADSTHVVIVTARVMDQALADVVKPLKRIRRSDPNRPVILALTCLHEAYPQQQHPSPDPFGEADVPDSLPRDLFRSLNKQRERFEGLVDRVVPLDLTKHEEGFAEPNFGGNRLKETLLDLLPTAYRQTLLSYEEAMQPLKDLQEKRALPYIVNYSMMAATAAAVPVPWVDIPVVMGIQSHLVYQLAEFYDQELQAPLLAKMAGSVGGRMFIRMAVRGSLKVIPVLGMATNAALAFAYTFSLGKVCCWYFGKVRTGNVPTEKELESVWQEQLTEARRLWMKHRSKEGDS